MKPLRLTMCAFGPYAVETRVSFEDVKEGLFLITGETGSGKTMVFDALMYALYDDTSGPARGNHSLRSDFADPGVRTFVELEFLLRSQVYTIRRSPRYERPSLRGGGTTEQAAAVELHLPDGRILASKREADQAIVELIGLDKSQFRQVAMIAQGAFFSLIEASSLDRARVYRRLFNTSLYEDMQNRLLARYSGARARRQALSNQLFLDLKRFPFPDWAEAVGQKRDEIVASQDVWAAGDFLAELKAVGSSLEKALAKADEESKNHQDQVVKAHLALESLRRDNRILDQLDQALEEKARLDSEEILFQENLSRLTAADRAGRLVTPTYRDWKQAVKDLEELEADLARTRGRYEEALKTHEMASRELERVKTQEAERTRLPGEISVLAKEVGDLEKLGLKKGAHKEAGDRLAGLEDKLKKLKAKALELEGVMKKERLEWESLADAGEVLHLRRRQTDEFEADLQKMAAIRLLVQETGEEQQKLEEARQDFEARLALWRRQESLAAEAAEKLFLERAGLLAEELEEGKPCPVCGSRQHPAKAALSPDAPSKEELEGLREEAEAGRRQSETLSGAIKGREERIKSAVSRAWSDAGKFLTGPAGEAADPAQGLEALELLLSDQGKVWEGELEVARDRLREAEIRKARWEELLEKEKSDSEELREIKEETAVQEAAAGSLREEVARLSGELAVLQKDLSGRDLDQLKQDLKARKLRLASLEEAWDKAGKAESGAASALAELEIRLGEMEKDKAGGEAEAATLEKAFQRALRQSDFESEAAYLDKVLEEEARQQLQREVETGKLVREGNRRDLARLREDSEGLVRRDEQEEAGKIERLEGMQAEGEEKVRGLKTGLEMAREAIRSVDHSFGQTSQALEEEALLKELADLASGKHKEADQINFESYVQTCYFAQVIEHANHRLGQMTGGRYRLHRTEEAQSRQARTGLDLSVVDIWNAKTRSVSSLSGGEKFQTVLSLALGLSDVVMAQAGGVEINSLFIDEGFGSLDENSLQEAIKVLQNLAEDKRMIGVISHLPLLGQAIDKKLVAKKADSGSTLSWV